MRGSSAAAVSSILPMRRLPQESSSITREMSGRSDTRSVEGSGGLRWNGICNVLRFIFRGGQPGRLSRLSLRKESLDRFGFGLIFDLSGGNPAVGAQMPDAWDLSKCGDESAKLRFFPRNIVDIYFNFGGDGSRQQPQDCWVWHRSLQMTWAVKC